MGHIRCPAAKRAAATIAIIFCLTSAGAKATKDDYMPTELIPSGMTVGLSVKSDGVMIVSLSEVETKSGKVNPAAEAGLLSGDIIKNVGSDDINCIEDFKKVIKNCDGEKVSVRVERDGKTLQFAVKPQLSIAGSYEMGVWLRDGIAGMGTMTFIDPKTGVFGLLGHAVSDVDTKIHMPLRSGDLIEAKVTSIVKGRSGAPGQIQGNLNPEHVMGKLYANTDFGVFGIAERVITKNRPIPVASDKELRVGEAVILSNLSDSSVEEYKIQISRVFPNNGERSMLITVTDDRLLAKTGGIVQGMSGSPIIQNGKLVGAVTHVLVNDPTKGYGITIGKMLERAYMTEGSKMAA